MNDDNIPLLNQIATEKDIIDLSIDEKTAEVPKKLQALRKKFEQNMNKKIRRTLQETERHLQKEMQNDLDQLFKLLSK